MYYNRFRYYSPDTGCYISQDPIGLAGNNPNIYAYVWDVNSWVDPLGLDAFTTWLNKGTSDYSNYVSKTYTGITNSLPRRIREHGGSKGVIRALENTGKLTKNQARAIEQAIIHNRGGISKKFQNIINSISPKRDIYKKAVEWGENWIKNNDEELAEELNLLMKKGCQ